MPDPVVTGPMAGSGMTVVATAGEEFLEMPSPTLTIDALGRKCPLPILMLAEQIGTVAAGDVVLVFADDPAAKTDIAAWCHLKSHGYLGMTDLPGSGWAFWVRRSY